MLLCCSSSCPAVASVPSLASISLPFVLGFCATGGGTFAPFCAGSVSPSTFAGEETSWLFCAPAFVSAPGLVSITTFLLLLAKTKLAVLDGDLRGSLGDVGESERRALGPPMDLAAVRRRIASCRFIEGDTDAPGGDLTVRDGTEDVDAGGAAGGSGSGGGGCGVTTAGGEVGEGRLIIRDFLIGFWGASALEDEAGILFLIVTPVSGCSCSCGASELPLMDGSRSEGDAKGAGSSFMTAAGGSCGVCSSVLVGLGSWFMSEGSCTGKGEGEGTSTGADGAVTLRGELSGLSCLEFSGGAGRENSCEAGPSVMASSVWWGSSMGGGGGIL